MKIYAADADHGGDLLDSEATWGKIHFIHISSPEVSLPFIQYRCVSRECRNHRNHTVIISDSNICNEINIIHRTMAKKKKTIKLYSPTATIWWCGLCHSANVRKTTRMLCGQDTSYRKILRATWKRTKMWQNGSSDDGNSCGDHIVGHTRMKLDDKIVNMYAHGFRSRRNIAARSLCDRTFDALALSLFCPFYALFGHNLSCPRRVLPFNKFDTNVCISFFDNESSATAKSLWCWIERTCVGKLLSTHTTYYVYVTQ